MSNLEQYRDEINRIDKEIARLFEQRMQVSREIGEYKKTYGLPVKDETRESEIIRTSRERITEEAFEPYYVDLQRSIMDISCAFQSRIVSGLKAGYSGVPGAYAYIAAKKMFPDAELIPYANFEPAFRAAERGEIDCAVLPLENSYAGEVGAVMDLTFSGTLFINRMMNLEIEHYLLGIPDTGLDQIKTVVSHPQALAQCDAYINEHGFRTIEYSNTARAAEYVKEQKDPSIAAIASEDTAELFGLKVLERKIHTTKNNTSRFGVFSRNLHLPDRDMNDDRCGFILAFTVPNEAGALAMTLDIIGSHGFNMRNLKSRPMKGLLWSYYFYVEADGNISSQEGEDMLREIGAICGQLKLAGSYTHEA